MVLLCVSSRYQGGIPLDCAALRRKKALLLLKHQLIGGFDDRVFAIKIHEKRAGTLKNNWFGFSFPK